jgi:flagellar motor switch protein FliM
MSGAAAKTLDDDLVSSLVQAILEETKPAETSRSLDLAALAKGLAAELSAPLAGIVSGVECWVQGIQACRYSDFTDPLSPSMFVLARPGQDRGLILFGLGAQTLDWWVTCSLCGEPVAGAAQRRDFTAIEIRIGRIALEHGLAGMVRTLSSFGIELSLRDVRPAGSAKDLPPLGEDPLGYAVRIGLSSKSDEQFISVFATDDLVRSWAGAIETHQQAAESPAQAKSNELMIPAGIETHLASVSVEIAAVLTAEPIELDQLLSWTPGVVVTLRATTETPVRLTSKDVPLFSGRLGKIDGRLCVQVGSAIDEGDGDIDEQLYPI